MKSNKRKVIDHKPSKGDEEVAATIETPLDILEKSIIEVMTITENSFTEKKC